VTPHVAINGQGRIDRAILKVVLDKPSLELVAVNDLAGVDNLAYDLDLTRVVDGDLVKIMSWYDNEWGFANQLLREALSVTGAHA
jgi:glyceraldehyde-3-phosphate dehydrogenase/erythrose-4-phosphate dehydrogenase